MYPTGRPRNNPSPILEEDEDIPSKTMINKSLLYVSKDGNLKSMEDTAFEQLRAEEKLMLMLSTRFSLVSLPARADNDPEPAESSQQRTYKQYGSGQCATLWSRTGLTQALKVPKPGKIDALYNDFVNHYRVRNAFEKTYMEFKVGVNVPRLGFWITPKSDKYWQEFLRCFPPGFKPTYGYLSERIFTLPYTLRRALFDVLNANIIQTSRSEFLSQNENYPCLVHLHLGRRDVPRPVFTLQNFNLAVDEMERLRLDTARFAKTIGKSLAILHWSAKIDAKGVEFILGTSASGILPRLDEYINTDPVNAGLLACAEDFGKRSVCMWIIDFDQCRTFDEKSPEGLKQLREAFAVKDAYYPKRPFASDNPKDLELWYEFKEAYLTASSELTANDMAADFMYDIENEF